MATIQIRGLDELAHKLSDDARLNRPIRRFLSRSGLVIEAKAKKAAPWDTGHLRRSITHQVEPRVMRVGTNVPYAPYVEYGTRAHWAPPGALAGWAKRKGIPESAARLAIAKRGTKAQPYMTPAVEGSITEIVAFAYKMVDEIEAEFAR